MIFRDNQGRYIDDSQIIEIVVPMLLQRAHGSFPEICEEIILQIRDFCIDKWAFFAKHENSDQRIKWERRYKILQEAVTEWRKV